MFVGYRIECVSIWPSQCSVKGAPLRRRSAVGRTLGHQLYLAFKIFWDKRMKIERVKRVPEFLLSATGSNNVNNLGSEDIRDWATIFPPSPIPVRHAKRLRSSLVLLIFVLGCFRSIVLYALVELFLSWCKWAQGQRAFGRVITSKRAR